MHKFTLYLKVTARRLSNPVFFMLLGLSLILWYVTKLSHSYTADINIPVRIDSVYYSVRCQVEGSGYQILLHKIAPRKNGQHRGNAVDDGLGPVRYLAVLVAKHHFVPDHRLENQIGGRSGRNRISKTKR